MGVGPAKAGDSVPVAGWTLLACSLLSVAFKAGLLALHAFPFNADEAIVGLMARHILGGERPTFFYGQAYLGSTDSILVAAAFALFGPYVGIIRAVQILLYAGTVGSTVILAGRAGLGRWGQAAAGLLMAIPVVNTTLYTTVSIGGYGEALLLGNLILLSTLNIMEGRPTHRKLLGWGVLAGFAFWTFGLTLVYSLPAFVLLAVLWLRSGTASALGRSLSVLVGGVLGALPMVAWGATHGPGALIRELLGGAIAGASSPQWAQAVWSHILNLVVFGTSVIVGARPPWNASGLALPLLPVALVFWVWAVFGALRPRASTIARGPVGRLLGGVALAVLAGFVLTPFGADPSGRYFLPLAVVLAFVGGAFVSSVHRRAGARWATAALAVPLGFALWGNVQAAQLQPPGITTQFDAFTRRDDQEDRALIEFLRVSGETQGYTTYWVSYPLAFLSNEELIFIPRLPYHADMRYTSRDDRYAPYGDIVHASSRVAFITSRHPELDKKLRDGLRAQGVTFEEIDIGGYHVFYRLSRTIAPSDLGIVEPGP